MDGEEGDLRSGGGLRRESCSPPTPGALRNRPNSAGHGRRVPREDGQFYGYLDWDAEALTARLRDSVLASFTRLGLLEEDTARTMQTWPVERSGSRVHVESAIPEEAREQLRTVLRYLTRAPVALERLSYDEATGEVAYRTRKGADLR